MSETAVVVGRGKKAPPQPTDGLACSLPRAVLPLSGQVAGVSTAIPTVRDAQERGHAEHACGSSEDAEATQRLRLTREKSVDRCSAGKNEKEECGAVSVIISIRAATCHARYGQDLEVAADERLEGANQVSRRAFAAPVLADMEMLNATERRPLPPSHPAIHIAMASDYY